MTSEVTDTIVEVDEEMQLSFFRQETYMVIVYSVFYGLVFMFGLLGNVFVVLAVALNASLRSTTDYLISSLALADLLIILFCLPTTLLNNILTEWHLGVAFCKLSTWINSTTSCASIYTLVAVTADRYLAICHTLKYTLWDVSYTLYVIVAIWIVSGCLAIPDLYSMAEIQLTYNSQNLTVCISQTDGKLHFIVVNLCLAFVVPFVLISVSYTRIFVTVSNHRSLAVDAHIRDERVKFRVATMMLVVIVVFALCWLPLYGIYVYFFFFANHESEVFYIASQVLRPLFQWLSLLSSSLNPLIYIAYSQKYRRAFHRILLRPCRSRYEIVRGTILGTDSTATSTTVNRVKKVTVSPPIVNCKVQTDKSGGKGVHVTPSLTDGSPMLTMLDSPSLSKNLTATMC